MRHCRRANLPPLAIIKSAAPLPASVAPSPVLPLNTIIRWSCHSYYLRFDVFFHQLVPSSKPQYQKILVTIVLTNLSPNFVWLLGMAKRLPSKHATTCYMRLMWWLITTLNLASVGSRRFRIHVSFRDQGGRILVPPPSIRWSDRRHHVYIWPRHMSSTLPTFVLSTLTIKCIFPECSPDGKLSSCWSLYDHHVQVRDAQTGQLICKFSASLVDGIALSPTFIKHYVSLTSKLAIRIAGQCFTNMTFQRDGTKLANYSPHFGLRHSKSHRWALTFRSWLRKVCEMDGQWVGTMSHCLWSVEHRKNIYVPPPGTIFGILQKKAISVDLSNSELSRKWTDWQRLTKSFEKKRKEVVKLLE